MNKFNLKLIAPTGVAYEGEVTEASIPTPDGQITILAKHMPLVTALSPGEIKLKTNGKNWYMATEGGIAYVAKNSLKILADTAESAESLDEAKIIEAKRKAEKLLSNINDEQEFAAVEATIEKQLAKLSFLKRRKRKL
jgi:F-type H+-transporting ATPase subunit epsilon